MHALKILVTPPSTSSTSPSTLRLADSDTSSDVSEDLNIYGSELAAVHAAGARYAVKPLPPLPSNEAQRPRSQRRTTASNASRSSMRPADDLLAQADILRDSANAARRRRPRFQEARRGVVTPHYHRHDDGLTSMNRRRASRLPCGSVPLSSREAKPEVEAAQFVIAAQSSNLTAKKEVSLGDSVHVVGGPDDARRVQIRCLSPELSSSSSGSWGSEKRGRKRDKLLRAPVYFFRRFLCFGDFDCTGQIHLVELHDAACLPVDRANSPTSSCARFDSLLHSQRTQKVHLRPRSSMVSPHNVIDIY